MGVQANRLIAFQQPNKQSCQSSRLSSDRFVVRFGNADVIEVSKQPKKLARNRILNQCDQIARHVLSHVQSVCLKILMSAGALLTFWLPVPNWRNYIGNLYLFQPKKHVSRYDLKDDGLIDKIEDVYFKSEDGTGLHGFYIPPQKDKSTGKEKPTLIYVHGRAVNIGKYGALYKALSDSGYGLLAFDYRGFGNSQGTPTEEGVYEDLEAASQFLTNKKSTPPESQIALGHSLGGAIVCDVAQRIPFKAVVLASTFSSLKELMHSQMKKTPWIINDKMVNNTFNSIHKIQNIKAPILVFHGDMDPFINEQNGKVLFNEAEHRPGEHQEKFIPLHCGHSFAFKEPKCADDFMKGLNQFMTDIDTPPARRSVEPTAHQEPASIEG